MPDLTRRRHALWIPAVLAAVVAAFLAAPGAAAEPGGPPPPPPRAFFRLEATTVVRGLDVLYRLSIDASRHGGDMDFGLQLSRVEEGVSQGHGWLARDATFACRPALDACRLDSGEALGVWGEVDVRFIASGEPRVTEKRCDSTGELLATLTRQRGVLHGVVRLDTGTEYFGEITNGASRVHTRPVIPAVATKQVNTGKSCPDGAAHACFDGIGIRGYGRGATFYVNDFRGPASLLWVGFDGPNRFAGVEVSHIVAVEPGKTIVRLTSNSPEPLERAAINLGQLSPFVDGDAVFEATGPLRERQPGCRSLQRNGVVVGDFGVHFDGFGDMRWPGRAKGIISRVFAD